MTVMLIMIYYLVYCYLSYPHCWQRYYPGHDQITLLEDRKKKKKKKKKKQL